jgi:hypothetical protein
LATGSFADRDAADWGWNGPDLRWPQRVYGPAGDHGRRFAGQVVAERIGGLRSDDVHPIPNPDIMEASKFTKCLSPEIATEVFTARFSDRAGVKQALGESRRLVLQN